MGTQVRPAALAPRADLFALAVLGAGLLLTASLERRAALVDPDRYYHFAVSRAQAATGTLRTLPQVEDLGWGERFVEKEYLFHQLTTLGWRLGEERGVEVACLLAAFVTLALVYRLARRRASWGAALSAVLVTTLLSPVLTQRLVLVRSHLLAMGAVALLLWGLLERRGWLVAGAAALFALSYHALYVPVVFAGCWWLCEHRTPGAWRLPALALAGLALASWASPAFPGNVESAWLNLRLALQGTSSEFVGEDVRPLAPWAFVTQLLPALVAFLGAAWWCWRAEPQARALVLAGAFFWAVCLRTPRGAEYALPVTAVLLAWAGSLVPPARLRGESASAAWLRGTVPPARQPASAGLPGPVPPEPPAGRRDETALTGLPGPVPLEPPGLRDEAASAVSLPGTGSLPPRAWRVAPLLVAVASAPGLWALGRPTALMTYTEGIARSVQALPTGPLKVLNCSFPEGAYLLYLRPEAHFVDVLDSTPLALQRPELSAAREALIYGRADPAETARRFHAQYVMCGYFPARALLEKDPHFRRVHPPPGEPPPRGSGPPVYQLLDSVP